MADIDITFNHAHDKATARTKAEGVLTTLGSSYGIKGTWAGDVFNITKPVEGKFTVNANNVRVELTLGFAMRMMKGKIEEEVRKTLQKNLG